MSIAGALALDPAAFVGEFYGTFSWIPTLVLLAALAIKAPTIVRMWKEPLLRAVGGLLLLACAVFVFVAPPTIAWVNRVTGVPNIAAPWVYSLLMAFCAACLLLIIAWREGTVRPSGAARRARRWVIGGYTGVIAALWVLFALADADEERLHDLDTHYATTPFMGQMIVLYLVAHCVAVLITSRLVWDWVRTEGLDAWLRWGLISLGAGYALNLVFDAAKFTAVAARWAGGDLDRLSTEVAPPVACLSAILIAAGFILPHSGQYLHGRWRVRRAHHRLRPLYLLMRSAHGSGAPVSGRSSPELRLIRRETFIRDTLLPLAPHLDEDLWRRSHDAALGLGLDPARARAAAGALAVQDAVARHRAAPDAPGDGDPDTTLLLQEIAAVSTALRRPDLLAAVRSRTAAPVRSVRVPSRTERARP
ncbi:MAB_1171c family putative transporter [Streptomyces sp. NPDC004610]|uniref:MAB_1171c family putative transporter n=1 Tax=unclassified Streptomyces TaxID=2593676 RepID=UPI0033ADF1B0